MKRWMRGAAVAAAAGLATAPALAAEQFDLICKAKKTEVRYRVDLTKGEWCAGDCSVPRKIASVTSGELVLEDEKPALRGDAENVVRINRSTGAWSTYAFAPRLESVPFTQSGQCEPAPFSGFPIARF